MPRKPLLIDVDTGVDDAIAIALATRLVTHELIAVATVAGNVSIDRSTENTLKVLEWLDYDAPVYRGMSAPLHRPLHTAEHFHGDDGLGGWQLPEPTRSAETETAPGMIARLAHEHRGEITFAFVGPLTNLAVALLLEPRITAWVDRLVIMGGAFYRRGNVSDEAEFNVFVDPEAAALVARANFNAIWVGLDVTQQTVLHRSRWETLTNSRKRTAILVHEVSRHAMAVRDLPEIALHDPLSVAMVENPDVVQCATGSVHVNVSHTARGETRLSEPVNESPPHLVATSVNTRAFHRMFDRLFD